jgi:hypothetical protein
MHAEITVVTKSAHGDPNGSLLSKRITLGPNGPVSDATPCLMVAGSAVTYSVPDAATFSAVITGLSCSDALALGSITGANSSTVNVVTSAMLAKLPAAERGKGVISRTREYLTFRPNMPAWGVLDHDQKGMPASVQAQIGVAGGAEGALLNVAPGLARAERLTRASTSTGLFNTATGQQYPGSGGMHIYILVQDGADIERTLKALHERSWLHGLGWFVISTAGHLLERSLIDTAVWCPERLVFEGAPDIVPPLAQDPAARACRVFAGEAIDTRVVVPDLTADERATVEGMKRAARDAQEPAAQVSRAAHDQKLADDLIRRKGMPREVAMRQVAARHRGILGPDIALEMDHLGSITVRHVLLAPDQYIGETLADPIEGASYGRNKAIILHPRDEPGWLRIYSFAHGGQRFDLRHDLSSATEALEAAPLAQLGDALCATVDAADLEVDEIRQLVVLCAARAPKVGLRAFGQRLKQDREARARRRRKAAAQHSNTGDTRHPMPLPGSGDEIDPIIIEVDRILASLDTDHPPMRRRGGTTVEVQVEQCDELHQLAMDGDPEGKVLEAPPEPVLLDMDALAVNSLIEQHIRFERFDRDGNPLPPGRLPEIYTKAFMGMAPGPVMPARPISQLPHVHGLVTLPMVAADGTIIDWPGLDRNSRMFFHIEPAVQDCIPRGPISIEAARAAIRFLLEDFLADTLTDIPGRLIAVGKGLTMIQRNLLPARPGFLNSSPSRGAGKTTLEHLVAMAVFGRMATAAPWSESLEERRKAFMSYLLRGVAAITFDNLPDGLELDCPVLAEILTAYHHTDRILGVSRDATVLATAVLGLNGINIRPRGATASRLLVTQLLSDSPRPENRKVARIDPVGWTLANRAKVLKALYTVLIYGCQNRLDGEVPLTRFKVWWRLVGWPVELAAQLYDPALNFTFDACFKVAEAQDAQKNAVETALRLLVRHFRSIPRGAPIDPAVQFGSVHIRSILDAGERAQVDPKNANPKAIADATEVLDMMETLRPGKRRHRSPGKPLIGEVLNGIVNRAVELDPTIIGILRLRTLHGDWWFHVETHASEEALENVCTRPNTTPAGAPSEHPEHPDTDEVLTWSTFSGASGPSDNILGASDGEQGAHPMPPLPSDNNQSTVVELSENQKLASPTETISLASSWGDAPTPGQGKKNGPEGAGSPEGAQGEHPVPVPDPAVRRAADTRETTGPSNGAKRSTRVPKVASRKTNGSHQPRTEERF